MLSLLLLAAGLQQALADSAVPTAVTAFVQQQQVPQVRSVKIRGAVNSGHGVVFDVSYGREQDWGVYEYATGFLIGPRIGWILPTSNASLTPGPPYSPSDSTRRFKIRPTDRRIVNYTTLQEMAALGLKAAWLTLLLEDVRTPLWAFDSIIARLRHDSDPEVAFQIASSSRAAANPVLLAQLALLPVPRDSLLFDDMGRQVGYIQATTGYVRARNHADDLLMRDAWRHVSSSPAPSPILYVLATYYDRNGYQCPIEERCVALAGALVARAVAIGDTLVLQALANETQRYPGRRDFMGPVRRLARAALAITLPATPN